MLNKMGNEIFEKSDKKALKEKHTLENQFYCKSGKFKRT